MKEKYKFILNVFFILLGAIFSGFLLMYLVYLIPTEKIKKNVSESVIVFATEETHKPRKEGHYETLHDNYTDSIFLLEAANENIHSPIKSAVLNERADISGNEPPETLVQIYADNSSRCDINYNIKEYGRYWHGTLVFLKTILVFLNYKQIRNLLSVIHIALVLVLLFVLIRKKKTEHIIAFIITWLFLCPLTLMNSIQFSVIFNLTVIELIILSLLDKKINARQMLYIFFIFGCMTSYFDLLTYPLVGLGIPLAFVISNSISDIKVSFIRLVKLSLMWGSGYALMWAGKWIGGSIISGTNILKSAAATISYRTSYTMYDEDVSYFSIVKSNYSVQSIFHYIVVICLLITLLVILIKKIKVRQDVYLLLLLPLLPFAWYMVTANHSSIHFWFTYRELAISIYATVLFIVMVMKKRA